MKHQHLVVTRYTVKGWAYDEFSPEWLEERVRVFRDYCVPSMERQSADFTWLVLCDESTDPDYVEEIRAAASGIPSFEVATTSPERKIWISQALASMVDPSADLLLTTRLDNDDALHLDALRAVQEYVEPFARSSLESLLVRFPRGYRYDEPSGRMFSSYWMDSPFITLLERPGSNGGKARGVYLAQHPKMHLEVPIHSEESLPAWIQVIHGRAKSTDPEALKGIALTGGNRRSEVQEDTDYEVDPAAIAPEFGWDLGRR